MFLHKTTKRQLCGTKFVIHRDGPGVDHTKTHLTLCVIVGCFRHFPTQIAMTLYSINSINTYILQNYSMKTKRSSNSANLLKLNVFRFNHRNKSTTVTFFGKPMTFAAIAELRFWSSCSCSSILVPLRGNKKSPTFDVRNKNSDWCNKENDILVNFTRNRLFGWNCVGSWDQMLCFEKRIANTSISCPHQITIPAAKCQTQCKCQMCKVWSIHILKSAIQDFSNEVTTWVPPRVIYLSKKKQSTYSSRFTPWLNDPFWSEAPPVRGPSDG